MAVWNSGYLRDLGHSGQAISAQKQELQKIYVILPVFVNALTISHTEIKSFCPLVFEYLLPKPSTLRIAHFSHQSQRIEMR
jgi:hypothetical protein